MKPYDSLKIAKFYHPDESWEVGRFRGEGWDASWQLALLGVDRYHIIECDAHMTLRQLGKLVRDAVKHKERLRTFTVVQGAKV